MSYRVFDPLPPNHPMVGIDEQRCAKCHEQFRAGELTTLIPVDPKCTGVFTVLALPAHATCLGWDPVLNVWSDP